MKCQLCDDTGVVVDRTPQDKTRIFMVKGLPRVGHILEVHKPCPICGDVSKKPAEIFEIPVTDESISH